MDPETFDTLVNTRYQPLSKKCHYCREGDFQGNAEAIVSADLDQSGEDFEITIELVLDTLEQCNPQEQEEGMSGSEGVTTSTSSSGGCAVATGSDSSTSSISNFFLTLIPAVFGFSGLIFGRRKNA